MRYETVWTFATARFRVELGVAVDHGYRYDGDDEDGETQAKLDSGEYVAFDSRVRVTLDGVTVGEDHLGASVYDARGMSDFWTAHRDPDPMNRNCTLMRAAWRGEGNPDAKVSICHYFPGMVAEAIAAARQHLAGAPKLRQVAA
ncbi:MAG: hypothetical protein AB7I52_17435 [Rhizobiaceae bacterium]